MSMKEDWKLIVFIIVILILSVAKSLGPNGSDNRAHGPVGFPVGGPELDLAGKRLSRANVDSVREPNKVRVDESGLDETAAVPTANPISPSESSGASQSTEVPHAGIPNTTKGVVARPQRTSGDTAATVAAAIAQTLSDLFAPQGGSLKGGGTDDARPLLNEQPKIDGNNPETLTPGAVMQPAEQDGSRDSEPQPGANFAGSNDSGKRRHGLISYVLRALGVHRDDVDPLS
jgi:hypothetical protein